MASGVEAATELDALMARASVVAVGPGLGQAEWGRAMFEACVDSALPRVVDADGLNWLARVGGHHDDWVLTPHPGEAARLLSTTTAEVQSDRFEAARAIHDRYGGVCVLKGAGTVIVDGQGIPALVTTWNAGWNAWPPKTTRATPIRWRAPTTCRPTSARL